MPDIISAGIAYKPIEKLTLAFDIEHILWSRFDEQKLNLNTELPSIGITDQTADLSWKNTWTYRFGLEYNYSRSVALRTGYSYIDTPVPNHTFSASAPSAKYHNLHFGIGYKVNSFTIDAYYAPAIYEKRTVSNTNIEGSYNMLYHYAGVGVTYNF